MVSRHPTQAMERPSAAARTLMKTLPRPEAADLSPDRITAYRQSIRNAFLARIERAVSASAVVTSWKAIAGVPCLEVIPPGWDGESTILHGFGGGFISGSPEEELIVTAPMAARTAARVIVPAYRLAPEHPWPAATDDGYKVYCELAGQLSAKAFALTGESAGGNLVLDILRRARRDRLRLPVALALMSPWCDLTHGGDSLEANDGRDPTLTRAMLEDAARLYAGDEAPGRPEISPLFAIWDATMPPTMITSGTRDLLLSQSIQLATALRAAGVPVDLRLWDHMWHVFEFYDELPEAADSLRAISVFLRARLL